MCLRLFWSFSGIKMKTLLLSVGKNLGAALLRRSDKQSRFNLKLASQRQAKRN